MKYKSNIVKNENIVFDNYLKIKEATIEGIKLNGQVEEYTRFALIRPDAVAVLIFNKDANTVVLIKQFRYPICDKVPGPIFEIPAGVIDKGEEALIAAIRETEEECGYRVKPGNIMFVHDFFTSSGYVNEKLYLYFAVVGNDDKVSNGGGIDTEHEDIEIIEIPASDFVTNMIIDRKIIDSKTLIAAYFLRDHISNEARNAKKD